MPATQVDWRKRLPLSVCVLCSFLPGGTVSASLSKPLRTSLIPLPSFRLPLHPLRSSLDLPIAGLRAGLAGVVITLVQLKERYLMRGSLEPQTHMPPLN